MRVLTKRDEDRDNDGDPEYSLPAQNNDFLNEVGAREERIDDDPNEHHYRRAKDDHPGNDSPAETSLASFTSRVNHVTH